jgi:roadblock/LC7 domain-containing protein
MPSQLFTAQFSPDGKFIAVGGTSTLLIVETAAAMSARLEVHGEFMPGGVAPAVFSAAWHPRGNAVAAVGASSSLIVLGASL